MKKIIHIVVFFLIVLMLNCARRGRPEGGPKDEDAPIMVTAVPPYETIEFKENEIKIYFDEYIVLKDLSKQLVVSPPFKSPVVISPQGTPSKYINIEIIDTLKPNTTYTFNFGNAVQDNNEGNKLESFKYVFSTGTYIDSLTLKGNVKNAFQRESEKSISVLLYKLDSSFQDSTIYKRKPDYVTNTLDSSRFNFTNIKEGKYLLLALKETAQNYLFSPKTDQIGFLTDTIVLPRDSVLEKDIRIFSEIQEFKMKRGKEVSKGKIQFGFLGDRKDLKVELLSKVPNNFAAEVNFEKDKDTLLYWHTPIDRDSLNFLVTNESFQDTLTVRLRKKKIDSLKITSKVNSVLHFNDTLFIEGNNPIVAVDTSKVSFLDQDTLKVKYTLKKINPIKWAFLFEKKPKTNYKLDIYPEGITDFYKGKNDTLNYAFGTKSFEDYGTIILNVENQVKKPIIVQLLKEKEVFYQHNITDSKKITYTLLEPQKYIVRAIIDENNNGKWDTGSYLEKRQPERVVYFEKEFALRANWEQNERFVIK